MAVTAALRGWICVHSTQSPIYRNIKNQLSPDLILAGVVLCRWIIMEPIILTVWDLFRGDRLLSVQTGQWLKAQTV